MRQEFKGEGGFTLVELMVVVLIIGILVAIAVPVFNAAKANAQKKACWANERTIDGAARIYLSDFTMFPASIADMTTSSPPYLNSEPTCPYDMATVYSWDASVGIATCASTASHGRYD